MHGGDIRRSGARLSVRLGRGEGGRARLRIRGLRGMARSRLALQSGLSGGETGSGRGTEIEGRVGEDKLPHITAIRKELILSAARDRVGVWGLRGGVGAIGRGVGYGGVTAAWHEVRAFGTEHQKAAPKSVELALLALGGRKVTELVSRDTKLLGYKLQETMLCFAAHALLMGDASIALKVVGNDRGGGELFCGVTGAEIDANVF